MTEEEAKTKACCGPPAVASATLLAARRPGLEVTQLPGTEWGHCIASACMAWRVREEQVETRFTDFGELPTDSSEQYTAERWVQVYRRPGETWDGLKYQRVIASGGGYCGLAGAPQ